MEKEQVILSDLQENGTANPYLHNNKERIFSMDNTNKMNNHSNSVAQNIENHNKGDHTMEKAVKQNAGNVGKHLYEASVKARAIQNAGGCNNLNGHILEIMGADKTNLNPFNGLHETLVKSRTAHAVDSVVTKGGKIVQRVQYKDTAKSIGDTVRRVKDGQYNSVTLKGTSETAEMFNKYAEKHGIAKRMQDTGISSNTTKSLARSCGAAKQVPLSQAAGMAAKSGGIIGGALSGGFSVITNTIALANGEKDTGEALGCIAKDTANGVLSGAGSAAAATVTGTAVASAVAGTAIAGTALGTACVVAVPLAAAIGVGCAISAIWNAIWD